MKRRDFLKAVSAGVIGWGISPRQVLSDMAKISVATHRKNYDNYIRDYLYKMRNFDRHQKGDVYVNREDFRILNSSVKRLKRLQHTVGHGNFHLLNFDDALKIARNYSRVGRFTRGELDFLEKIFHEDAALYGFMGKKTIKNITHNVKCNATVKVPFTGNYLYNGHPFETYRRITKIVGNKVIMTSGVRSVIKQFQLFLNKAFKSSGNLSLASRSLAPPGYSFHGIGDFDVGQVGFGIANFTERFVTTEVYRRLEALGYLTLRYPQDNHLGVRYEPWHIKVTSLV